jgi:hypothetical protein
MKAWIHTEIKTQYWVFLDGTLRLGWGPDAILEYTGSFLNKVNEKQQKVIGCPWEGQTPWGESGWTIFESDARIHPAWNKDVANHEHQVQKEEFREQYVQGNAEEVKLKGPINTGSQETKRKKGEKKGIENVVNQLNTQTWPKRFEASIFKVN